MMASPRLQHNSGELRAVADMLDKLDQFGSEFNDIGIEGELIVYWVEIPMGRIVKEDDCWVYYPEAEKYQ